MILLAQTKALITGGQLEGRGEEGRGGRGGLPCPFLKIEKKCPDFGKKWPDYVLPWVKFSIQNVVLRVSEKLFFCF